MNTLPDPKTWKVKSAQNKKFDFLFVNSLRGASTAFQTYLPMHPEVFAVPKSELDIAIENTTETGLLRRYQAQVMEDRPDLKVGLVQHGFMAGLYAGPEVAERLADVTNTDCFVQCVREPTSLIKSYYNHTLVGQLGGSYYFGLNRIDAPWAGKYDLSPLMEVTNSNKEGWEKIGKKRDKYLRRIAGYNENLRFNIPKAEIERLINSLPDAR